MLKSDGTLVLSSKSVQKNDKKGKNKQPALTLAHPPSKLLSNTVGAQRLGHRLRVLGTTLMSRNVHTESGK